MYVCVFTHVYRYTVLLIMESGDAIRICWEGVEAIVGRVHAVLIYT